MMLTRCPACQTAFRVRPEQLRLRQGRVRCGSCGKAFNALASLIDEAHEVPGDESGVALAQQEFDAQPQTPDEQAAPPQTELETAADAPTAQPAGAAAASHFFVLEEKAGVVLSHDPLTHDIYTPITPDDSADLLIESFQRYRPQTAEPLHFGQGNVAIPSDTPAALAGDGSVDTASLTHELTPRTLAAAAPATDTLCEPDEDLSARIEASQVEESDMAASQPCISAPPPTWPQLAKDDTAEFPEEVDAPPAMPTLLAERQESSETDAPPTPATDATADVADSDAQPSTILPDAEEPIDPLASLPEEEPEDEPHAADETPTFELEPASRPRTWTWGLGIGLLAIALLAQGSLLFRQEIIERLPQVRPLYVQLCAHIGCSMALPREASKIAIESSDLHPEQGAANFFRLRATIRNRATFEQAYPHLELTLTDAEDRPLARKVLEPEQWRPADAPAGGFPAARELEVSVPFETKDVPAVGYRIYVFYP